MPYKISTLGTKNFTLWVKQQQIKTVINDNGFKLHIVN
jgi:hypothetical protein